MAESLSSEIPSVVDASTSTFNFRNRSARNEQVPYGQHPQDEYYNMSNKNRGIAVIFNHRLFDDPYYKERRGTDHDRDAIMNVLKKLKFHIKICDDYAWKQIDEMLQVVSKMDHSTNDCLVIVVMTHGKSNGRLTAKDEEYTTDELMGYFTGNRCPSLAGKPKLFFIQACRGQNVDSGVRLQFDGPTQKSMSYTIPEMADILIMYATVEGYYAWRDTSKGSCFIQSLARKLDAHHKDRELLSILTLVNREVAVGFQSRSVYDELNEKKEMCSFVSMLTRELFFG